MTETCSTPVPIQAAIDLCIALGIPDHHAPTIQAAFAEREARLVGALEIIARAEDEVFDEDLNQMVIVSMCENQMQQIASATLAALKDRTHG